MKTKLLYILVSSEKDIYLEQAYISMASAKHHMPDVQICLIMDQLTERSLKNGRGRILDFVSEKSIINLPENLTGQQRSRILKTSCREYVKGDFLFIDCDTIILQSLEEIDTIPYELAACRDSHANLNTNPYKAMCINHCKKLGLDITNETEYYNSGIILAKDTPKVRDFYKRWNQNWKAGRKRGILMDQPAFAKTNIEFHHFIKHLPDTWNCQVIHGIKYMSQAKIIHYLTTSPTKKGDVQVYLLRDRTIISQLKPNYEIPKEITDCFDNPFSGLPDCVHVLAGQNMFLCQTPTFKYISRITGTRIFKFWNGLFKIFILTPRAINKILNKIKQ